MKGEAHAARSIVCSIAWRSVGSWFGPPVRCCNAPLETTARRHRSSDAGGPALLRCGSWPCCGPRRTDRDRAIGAGGSAKVARRALADSHRCLRRDSGSGIADARTWPNAGIVWFIDAECRESCDEAIAWCVFRENVDRRLLSGALAIVLGAIALSWEGQGPSLDAGAALIAGACSRRASPA